MAPLKSLLVESISVAPHPSPGKKRQALGYFNGERIGGGGWEANSCEIIQANTELSLK